MYTQENFCEYCRARLLNLQDYNFSILHGTVTVSSWRQLLFWLGVPGLAIAALALLTLDEPRKPTGNVLGDVFSSSKFTSSATRDLSRSQKDSFETAKVSAKAKKEADKEEEEKESFWNSVKELLGSPVFQVISFQHALYSIYQGHFSIPCRCLVSAGQQHRLLLGQYKSPCLEDKQFWSIRSSQSPIESLFDAY